MNKYKLIVMSFDGSYVEEKPEFETIDKVWEYSNDLGSKWYFYPFHFVIKGKTIKDACEPLDIFKNKRINTVKTIFNKHSRKEETQNMDCDEFAFSV